ncbi:MAG: DUF4019 domain-containing protein [Woeseiaceae bacterium]|nr:DUF4019 domain-containing protein [Woeseiaceae bacterium]
MTGLLLSLVAACASNEVEPGDSPQSAAEAFLSLIDKGDYEGSWNQSSAWLRSMTDADQWAEHAGSYRQPLGDVLNREVTSIEIQESLEDMPAGQYAFVTFSSSLADGRNVTEMIGLMLDDDAAWRVIGYQTQ